MKALKYIGIFIIALIIIAVIALNFINFNQYKPQITQEFNKATGLNIEISGDISLGLFPIAGVVEGVTITNPNSTNSDVATAKTISAKVSFWDAITGDITINSLTIDGLNANLVADKNGKGNWVGDKKPPANNSDTVSDNKESDEISFDDISLKNSNIKYSDANGSNYEINDINLSNKLLLKGNDININTIGSLKFKEQLLGLRGSAQKTAQQISIDAQAEFGGNNIKIKTTDLLNSQGQFEVNANDLNKILTLAGIKTSERITDPIQLTGTIAMQGEQINLSNAKLNFAGNIGTADIKIKGPIIEANLDFDEVNTNNIVAIINKFESAQPTPQAANDNTPTSRKKLDKSELDILLYLNAKKLTHGKHVLNNLQLDAEYKNQDITIKPLEFELPGGTLVDIYGIIIGHDNRPRFEGSIVADSKDITTLLTSLDIDAGNIKQVGNNLKFSADGVADANSAALTKLRANIGKTVINGTAGYAYKGTKKVQLNLNINQLNLDKLKVNTPQDTASNATPNNHPKKQIDLTWLDNLPIDFDVKTKISRLTTGGINFNNFKLDSKVSRGELKIAQIYASSKPITFAGVANIKSNNGGRPNIAASFNLGNINTANFKGNSKTTSSTNSGSSNKQKWSNKAFSFKPLDEFDGSFKINAKSLQNGNLRFDNLNSVIALKNGQIDIKNISAILFGGKFDGKGQLNIYGIPSTGFSYNISNLSLQKMLTNMANNSALSGVANIAGNFSSNGVNEADMIKNLNGTTNIAASNLTVRGMDLHSFSRRFSSARQIFDIPSLLNVLTSSSGRTRLDTVTGTIHTKNGIMSTTGIKSKLDIAHGVSTGSVDLPNWQIDVKNKFNISLPNQSEKPGIGIDIKGNLDSFKTIYNTSEIEKYLASKGTKKILKYIDRKGILNSDKIPSNIKDKLPAGLEQGLEQGLQKGVNQGLQQLLKF